MGDKGYNKNNKNNFIENIDNIENSLGMPKNI